MLSTRLQTDKKWIDGKTDRQMNRQIDRPVVGRPWPGLPAEGEDTDPDFPGALC